MFDRRNGRGRLLMLAPIMPSDRGNGLAMRAGFFLDAYSRRFEVDLVVAPVAGSAEASAFVRSRVRRIEVLDLARPESQYALVAAVRDPSARLAAFRRFGRPSLAAFIAPACHSLDGLAADERYQAVHICRLYIAELATPWIGMGRHRPRIVLDCDENDILAHRRLAGMERRRQDPVAAAWAQAEAEAFARFASSWLPNFDRLFASSNEETKSLSRFGVRAFTVPNVVHAPARSRQRRTNFCSILFIGTLGYAPNADAVTWFVSRIWRRLERALRRRVRLVIVGSDPPSAVRRIGSQRGIKVAGAVADVARYYRQADLVVAPIRAGGGTRIKIIEAAAHAVPIVATSFATRGTTFQHGADMLLADDETSFLRACVLLARDRPLAARLAVSARSKAKRDYSPAYWRARVADLVGDCGGAHPIGMPEEELDVGDCRPGAQS
jgi:glycosyltransferase involved in cell wall biosynthesis